MALFDLIQSDLPENATHADAIKSLRTKFPEFASMNDQDVAATLADADASTAFLKAYDPATALQASKQPAIGKVAKGAAPAGPASPPAGPAAPALPDVQNFRKTTGFDDAVPDDILAEVLKENPHLVPKPDPRASLIDSFKKSPLLTDAVTTAADAMLPKYLDLGVARAEAAGTLRSATPLLKSGADMLRYSPPFQAAAKSQALQDVVNFLPKAAQMMEPQNKNLAEDILSGTFDTNKLADKLLTSIDASGHSSTITDESILRKAQETREVPYGDIAKRAIGNGLAKVLYDFVPKNPIEAASIAVTNDGIKFLGEEIPALSKPLGEISATFKDWLANKSVDVTIPHEAVRNFYIFGRENLSPEAYDALIKIPKEDLIDAIKAGRDIHATLKVPRGTKAPTIPEAAAPAPGGVPLGQEMTVVDGTVLGGPAGVQDLQRSMPVLADSIIGKPLPYPAEVIKEAIGHATEVADHSIQAGVKPHDAQVDGLKSFTDYLDNVKASKLSLVDAPEEVGMDPQQPNASKTPQETPSATPRLTGHDLTKAMDLEPHELTYGQFKKVYKDDAPPDQLAADYRQLIQTAVNSGKPVSPEVLGSVPQEIPATPKPVKLDNRGVPIRRPNSVVTTIKGPAGKPVKITHQMILDEADGLYQDAQRRPEADPLAHFVKSNGGLRSFQALHSTGIVPEAEEMKDVPLRFKRKAGLPADEMAQMAFDAGVLEEPSADLLRNQLKDIKGQSKVPALGQFYDEALRNLEHYASHPPSDPFNSQEEARSAAQSILESNGIDEQVGIGLVEHIAVDPEAFRSSYSREFDKNQEVARGVTIMGSNGSMNAVIKLAKGATKFTGRHEAFHAVTNLLLDDSEKKILLDNHKNMEEAADHFARYRDGGKVEKGALRKIFEKIKAFLERLKNFLTEKEFKTAQDIHEAIDRGEFKTRVQSAEGNVPQYSVDKKQPSFFSQVERAIAEKMPAKTSPEQVMGMLKNTPGVKGLAYSRVHALDITPSMKESVMQGQPLYSVGKLDGEYAKAREEGAGDLPKETIPQYVQERKNVIADFFKYIGQVSSKSLFKIGPELMYATRRFESDYRQQTRKDLARSEKFLHAMGELKKKSSGDFLVMDIAMKNGDIGMQSQIAQAHGFLPALDSVRILLEEMRGRIQSVGYEVGYRTGYFPRVIRNKKGLIKFFQKQNEIGGEIDHAIHDKEAELGRQLSDDEKANLINSFIRGFVRSKVALSKTGNMKTREIDKVTVDLNKFYYSGREGLIRYIEQVNEAVEARKFFGRVEVKPDLDPAAKAELAKMSEAEKKESALSWNNIQDSIGAYVNRLLDQKKISPDQQLELRNIFLSRFGYIGTSGIFGLYKNIEYMSTIANPIAGLSQLDDLAAALYMAPWNTTGSFIRAIANKSNISLQDLGLESIAEEIREASATSAGLRWQLRKTGFTYFDRVMKETHTNALIDSFRDKARAGDSELDSKLVQIFGSEADSVIDDLKAGRTSENVLFLAFNELSDYQPITLLEVPRAYQDSPGARVFYMLKTFFLKRLDFLLSTISKAPDKKTAIKNFLHLYALMMICGMGVDVAKDLILHRKISPTDLMIDNLLKPFGISKFLLYRVRDYGPAEILVSFLTPSHKLLDSIWKDLRTGGKPIKVGNHHEPKGLETPAAIPIGGKLWYWWQGRGAQKTRIQEFKSEHPTAKHHSHAGGMYNF